MNQKIEKTLIPVMHCFDNNYVIPASVSFYSMLARANKEYFYQLYVLHSDITVQNQLKLTELVEGFDNAALEFIDMSHRFDDIWNTMTNRGHFSKEVLYKILAPSIFPQYDKIIMTDVDVVFLGDISPSYLFLNPDSKELFAGVRQVNPDKTFLREYYENYKKNFSENEYRQLKVCGGYLVANLNRQREIGMTEVFVSYLKNNAHRLLQAEQDVINFCCREEEISFLPLNYVVCSYFYDIFNSPDISASDPHYSYYEIMDSMRSPIQLHFATGVKPWNSPNSIKAEIWFETLDKTGFRTDYDGKLIGQQFGKRDTPGKSFFVNSISKFPVKVSVVICTYQHRSMVEQALLGVLNQKVDFPIEVIVADDGSTDGTQEIIKKYQAMYPDKISKCILRSGNIGIGNNYYDALTKADGKYVAICDGNDWWIDDCKLKKQVDYLELNPDCSIVCSDFINSIEDNETQRQERFDVEAYLKSKIGLKERYTFSDLLYCQFIASCTMVLRWGLHGRIPDFLKSYQVIDFPLMLIHASCGYIKVINEPMAVHRVHFESLTGSGKEITHAERLMVLKEVDQFLGFRLTSYVSEYTHPTYPVEKSLLKRVEEKIRGVLYRFRMTIKIKINYPFGRGK